MIPDFAFPGPRLGLIVLFGNLPAPRRGENFFGGHSKVIKITKSTHNSRLNLFIKSPGAVPYSISKMLLFCLVLNLHSIHYFNLGCIHIQDVSFFNLF